jgi:hypothetical protein
VSPSPDINRKIEESKNRSWVCPSPTFDFLTIIQTEIKKSKNRRIEESQIEVEVVTTDRRQSEFIYFSATVSNLLPPPPLLHLSSFHCVCEHHIASKAAFSSEAFTDPHINLHFAE